MPTQSFISEFGRVELPDLAELLSRYVREACASDKNTAASELSKAAYLPIEEDAAKKDWEVMSLNDLLAHESASGGVQWLLPNVIAKKGIHIISCAPGGTKSWLMLEMARAFTSGGQFLSVFDVEKIKCLYIDEEMGKDKMSTRVKKMGFAPDSPFFYMGLQQFKLDIPEQLAKLKKMVEEQGIEIVFIDTLTRVHNVRDENDNAAMRVIFQSLSELTKAGLTVVVAHHDRKRGGDDTIAHERMRGAQEIGAMADMAFSCEKLGGTAFRFIGTKCRLIPEDDRINIEYFVRDNEDKTETEVVGVSNDERVFVQQQRKQTSLRMAIGQCLSRGPLKTEQIVEMVDGRRAAVLSELKTMVADGSVLSEKNKGQGGGNVYTFPPSESGTEEVVPIPVSKGGTSSPESDTEDL